MADHHGGDPRGVPEFVRQMLEEPLKGATGTYPEGRLGQHDDGAIQFALGERDGKVILDFGNPVSWLGMNPQQAVALAEAIIAKARVVARRTGTVLTVRL